MIAIAICCVFIDRTSLIDKIANKEGQSTDRHSDALVPAAQRRKRANPIPAYTSQAPTLSAYSPGVR
jgi:hypothetical protein